MNEKIQNIGILVGAIASGIVIYKEIKKNATPKTAMAVNSEGKGYMQTAQNDGGIIADIVGGGGLTWL